MLSNRVKYLRIAKVEVNSNMENLSSGLGYHKNCFPEKEGEMFFTSEGIVVKGETVSRSIRLRKLNQKKREMKEMKQIDEHFDKDVPFNPDSLLSLYDDVPVELSVEINSGLVENAEQNLIHVQVETNEPDEPIQGERKIEEPESKIEEKDSGTQISDVQLINDQVAAPKFTSKIAERIHAFRNLGRTSDSYAPNHIVSQKSPKFSDLSQILGDIKADSATDSSTQCTPIKSSGNVSDDLVQSSGKLSLRSAETSSFIDHYGSSSNCTISLNSSVSMDISANKMFESKALLPNEIDGQVEDVLEKWRKTLRNNLKQDMVENYRKKLELEEVKLKNMENKSSSSYDLWNFPRRTEAALENQTQKESKSKLVEKINLVDSKPEELSSQKSCKCTVTDPAPALVEKVSIGINTFPEKKSISTNTDDLVNSSNAPVSWSYAQFNNSAALIPYNLSQTDSQSFVLTLPKMPNRVEFLLDNIEKEVDGNKLPSETKSVIVQENKFDSVHLGVLEEHKAIEVDTSKPIDKDYNSSDITQTSISQSATNFKELEPFLTSDPYLLNLFKKMPMLRNDPLINDFAVKIDQIRKSI